MAVSAGSKNPERALMVYDLLRNDKECYDLFNYGILGEQYVLNEKGELERPEGFNVENDQITTNYWWGRNDDLEINNATHFNSGKAEKFAEYAKFAIEYPYGEIVFDTSQISTEMANLSAVWTEYMPRIAFGKIDNPESYVKEFRDALKAAGIEKVIAELQKQMDVMK